MHARGSPIKANLPQGRDAKLRAQKAAVSDKRQVVRGFLTTYNLKLTTEFGWLSCRTDRHEEGGEMTVGRESGDWILEKKRELP